MSYSIGEFARLCGINATTLRAWQRRYGLLKPLRTDGGHRQYSDDDIPAGAKNSRLGQKRGACQPG
ncbi:HTH-type transcriptional repressor YcgE [Raoultella terrigena]|uniref:HTH-type transcriptional repressor YcgE n=1 Tax=Raoultella terrigena TaxID=577 RepID=A0A4U9DD00_RAOTE|nr:HTH-type transcriptional repressor YcgE [Raoultella terrigena]